MQGREQDAGCLAEQTDGGHFAHALEPLAVAASRPSAHTVVKEEKKQRKKKKALREQRTSVPEWPREFAQRRSLCNARTRRLQ